MRLLLATNNAHKRGEFAEIFPDVELAVPSELGIEFDAEETGITFLENAMIKARTLVMLLGDTSGPSDWIVVADDSGLCVDALDGAPGIYSARYGSSNGGPDCSAGQRNALLLDRLRGVTQRGAHFVCCMVAILPDDRLVVAQESWQGTIAETQSAGAGGFGYDPVFVVPGTGVTVPGTGVTAADLSAEEKNRLSHRGRASRVLAAALVAAAENATLALPSA